MGFEGVKSCYAVVLCSAFASFLYLAQKKSFSLFSFFLFVQLLAEAFFRTSPLFFSLTGTNTHARIDASTRSRK